MTEHAGPEMTIDELRAISDHLRAYVALHPNEKAATLAARCNEIATMFAAQSSTLHRTAVESFEDRVLRIVSGAPLTRREVRVAGIFALIWFAMDAFWFISTLNHWFGL